MRLIIECVLYLVMCLQYCPAICNILNCNPRLKKWFGTAAYIRKGLYSNAAYIGERLTIYAFIIWSFWNVWNWSIWSNTVVICKGNYVRKDSCSNSYSLQILSGLGPEENCPVNVLNDIYQLFFFAFRFLNFYGTVVVTKLQNILIKLQYRKNPIKWKKFAFCNLEGKWVSNSNRKNPWSTFNK